MIKAVIQYINDASRASLTKISNTFPIPLNAAIGVYSSPKFPWANNTDISSNAASVGSASGISESFFCSAFSGKRGCGL